jgi:cyclopropane fatty-acyl-phospholipid synthase-like methyltransferase
MPHRFEDADRWAAVFEAPERDAWQQPDVVVKRLVTRDDMTIADIGAGTGYFSVRFARGVPKGKVIAVDIERTLLGYLDARAAKEGLANLRTSLAQPEDPDLHELRGAVDLVFMCNTYHHIADRPAYFAHVAEALAPDGRVAIVDFRLDSPRGPPRQHKVTPETVIAELERAGLALVGRWDELPDQYLLEFRRSGR